ncbi:MAG: HU family DNA-binding protein [Spirochaetes bacterium]|nr:HU family DNA-binding protein [Spirochaetota bacterium]
MNKADLIAAIKKKADAPSKKIVEDVINAFIDVVKGELKKKGTVQLVGFGTFKVVERKAREGRNPKTGQKIKIPATKVPKFVPGKDLREIVK